MSSGTLEARLVLDDDAIFEGHYPGAPILPGSFLIEALFQAACATLGGDWRLAELASCRFHAPLLPGDVIQARLTISEAEAGQTRVEATATGRAEAGQIRLLLAKATTPLEPRAIATPIAPPGRELDPTFIRRTLPHRFPMLLIDRAVVSGAETSKPSLVASKAVTLNEPCYATPGELTWWGYPESLVAESFCQACGLLRAGSAPAGSVRDPSKVPVLARLVKLRFVGQVLPGEVLEHHVRMTARTPEGAVFTGESVAAGRIVLQAERVVAAMAPLPSSAGC